MRTGKDSFQSNTDSSFHTDENIKSLQTMTITLCCWSLFEFDPAEISSNLKNNVPISKRPIVTVLKVTGTSSDQSKHVRFDVYPVHLPLVHFLYGKILFLKSDS